MKTCSLFPFTCLILSIFWRIVDGSSQCDPRLHAAVRNLNLGAFKQLLRDGVNFVARDDQRQTPLHIAAATGQHQMVKMLLNEFPWLITQRLCTSCVLSHLLRDYGAVGEFPDRAAYVNAGDSSGDTALHVAVRSGQLKVAKILLRNGADIHRRSNLGGASLHFAATLGNLDMARLLMRNGADVNVKDSYEFTSLHHAAAKGHFAVVSALLHGGASVNECASEGKTALHVATMARQYDVVEFLVNANADRLVKDHHGMTALHYAITEEMPHQFIVCLVRNESDLAVTLHGKTVRELVIANMIFIDIPALPPALWAASHFISELPSRFYYANDVSINDRDPEDGSAECMVCRKIYTSDDILVRLPCHPAHVFHEECLLTFFERRGKGQLCYYCHDRGLYTNTIVDSKTRANTQS